MIVGQWAQTVRAFSEREVSQYAALSGGRSDRVPEPLIGGLFSYLLGTQLPGRGTRYLKQSLNFQACPQIGEPLTARVEITRLRPEKNLVDLRTTCHAADGSLICDGRALVLYALA